MNVIKESGLVFSVDAKRVMDEDDYFTCSFKRVVGYEILRDKISDGVNGYSIINNDLDDEYICLIDVDRDLAYDVCNIDLIGSFYYDGHDFKTIREVIESKFPTIEFI